MFPPTSTFNELMRGALGTAVEFATLGEVRLAGRRAGAAPITHPHRLALRPPSRPRRPGAVPPRPPVCTAPGRGGPG